MQEPVPTRRRPILPFAMLGLVLLLAAGWSVLWFHAFGEANARFDEFLQAEAARGRVWTCRDRHSGGYPFRIDIGCSAVEGEVLGADGERYGFAAGRFLMVARAYSLGHVVAELDGPLAVARPGAAEPLIRADWQRLRASAKARPHRIDQIDIAAEQLTGEAPALAGLPAGSFGAAALELHARVGERRGDHGDIDLAASGSGLVLGPQEDGPPAFSGEVLAVARNAPLRATADPVAVFAGAGGALEIQRMKLEQNGMMIHLRGALRLDAEMRPEGDLELAAGGSAGQAPGGDTVLGGLLPIMSMALSFAGRPTEIDGAPASAANLSIRGGEIRLGPITLGTVPPLR